MQKEVINLDFKNAKKSFFIIEKIKKYRKCPALYDLVRAITQPVSSLDLCFSKLVHKNVPGRKELGLEFSNIFGLFLLNEKKFQRKFGFRLIMLFTNNFPFSIKQLISCRHFAGN